MDKTLSPKSTKRESNHKSFQLSSPDSSAIRPPKAWLIINIVLTALVGLICTYILIVFLGHGTYIASFLEFIFSPLFILLGKILAHIPSSSDLELYMFIIIIPLSLIMNPICALGYLIENHYTQLRFAIKNLIFAAFPLIFIIITGILLEFFR